MLHFIDFLVIVFCICEKKKKKTETKGYTEKYSVLLMIYNIYSVLGLQRTSWYPRKTT